MTVWGQHYVSHYSRHHGAAGVAGLLQRLRPHSGGQKGRCTLNRRRSASGYNQSVWSQGLEFWWYPLVEDRARQVIRGTTASKGAFPRVRCDVVIGTYEATSHMSSLVLRGSCRGKRCTLLPWMTNACILYSTACSRFEDTRMVDEAMKKQGEEFMGPELSYWSCSGYLDPGFLSWLLNHPPPEPLNLSGVKIQIDYAYMDKAWWRLEAEFSKLCTWNQWSVAGGFQSKIGSWGGSGTTGNFGSIFGWYFTVAGAQQSTLQTQECQASQWAHASHPEVLTHNHSIDDFWHFVCCFPKLLAQKALHALQALGWRRLHRSQWAGPHWSLRAMWRSGDDLLTGLDFSLICDKTM